MVTKRDTAIPLNMKKIDIPPTTALLEIVAPHSNLSLLIK